MNQSSKILSIQSQVAYGYVGNKIAEFAIQLHGFEAICLPTVMLSNHTGYKYVYGRPVAPELFAELVKGVDAIRVSDYIRYAVSGYIGSAEIAAQTREYMLRLKSRGGFTYICDPVMGDNGELYVPADVAESIIANLIPVSDIITPNHFELEYILQEQFDSVEKLLRLLAASRLLRGKTVIATNVQFTDTPPLTTESVIVKDGAFERVTTEYVPIHVYGTGDLFAALLTAKLAEGEDVVAAVRYAAHSISEMIKTLKTKEVSQFSPADLVRLIKG